MEYKEIEFSIEEKIATIILNNPQSLNALSFNMALEIINAIEKAEEKARVIIITGAGRAFCSGTNLSGENVKQLQQGDIGIALEEYYNPLLEKIRAAKLPIICAINGPAIGIGCPLALMGDIIIAAKSAYFMQGFLNIGLIPDGGSAYLLAHTIGRVKAMEMMLLGNKIMAQEALARGLITQYIDDENLTEHVTNIAQKIAQGPKFAMELMRKSAWAALDNEYITQLKLERELQKQAGNDKDFFEGVSAFMQKRPPNFGE